MPVSKRQKQISVILLYNCLNNNANAASLITRIFPKSLFRKVDSTSNDISKWTLIQWEELFDRIGSNYSTATEQWNDDCRLELLQTLRRSQNDFDDHWFVLEKSKFQELIESSAKSRDGQLEPSKANWLIQLRWNFEEYEAKYSVLDRQLPVWKYYLEQLYEEGEEPNISCEIYNAKKFWEELSIQLISREDYYVRKKIIQTMILVYKEYYEKIKELSLLPYLIKVLSVGEDDFGSFHYLILQLIFTALHVQDPHIAHQNTRKFNEKGGLQTIRTHLAKKYFFENLDELSYEETKKMAIEKAENRRKVSGGLYGLKSGLKDSITYNFSPAVLKRQAYSQLLKKANEILLCLNIIKECVAKTKSESEEMMLFPRPLARQMISEKESVNLFNQLLLIKDAEIVQITQEIIALAYFNRFSFKLILTNTNYFERVLSGMGNQSTGEIAANNFRQIFYLVVQDASEEVKKMLGRFSTYGYLDADFEEVETEKDKALKEKVFEVYPLFKSLPWAMIFILVRNGWQDFVKVFYSNSYQMPNLLWNADMRRQLLHEMREKFRGEFDRLKTTHDKFLNSRLSSGIFEPLYQPSRVVEYKAVTKELVCDNIFLKIWIMPEYEDTEIPEAQVPRIISRLHRMLDKKVDSLLNDPNPELAVSLQEKIKDIYIILKANLKILQKYNISTDHPFITVQKVLEIWNSYVFNEQAGTNPVTANLWELVVANSYKIITLSLNQILKENLEDFKKNISLKRSILRNVSKIANKVVRSGSSSLNSIRIVHQFVKILKQLQMCLVSPAEIFADVDTSGEDYYDFFTLLNLLLEPYSIYFKHLMLNSYSTIYESNRNVPMENIKKSVYIVFNSKNPSDMATGRMNSVSPLNDELGTISLDPSLSNALTFLKEKYFSSGFNFVVEEKVFRLTQDTLEIIDELSESSNCALNLVKSQMLYRLFQLGTYYIPREVRNSQESMQDSNFQLIENIKVISDLAFKSLRQLTIMFLEGSINAGSSELEELLRGMDNSAFNKIKENADTIRFEDNKRLENGLRTVREFFGDTIVKGIIKIYLEPDRIDLFRDDLISAPEVIDASKIGFSLALQDSSEKLQGKIVELRESVEAKLFSLIKDDSKKVVGIARASVAQSTASELCVQGVFVSSYVHSPFKLDNPLDFVKDASEKMLLGERKHHQNLILILKAITNIIRDEPDLEIPQFVVERLVKMYSELEAEWAHIKTLIADLFISLSTMMINLPREPQWLNSVLLHRLIHKMFLEFNGSQSEEAYQLILRWSLVVAQIINTEFGLKAIYKFQHLLGISKIAFETSFPIFLRNKLADCILRLYSMQAMPLEYKKMLATLIEVCGLRDILNGEQLVKAIDREIINPCFVITRITAYKNRERYNTELKLLIDKLDSMLVTPGNLIQETDLE